MGLHPLLWLLFGFNIHEWNPDFITCYSYDVTEKFIAIFMLSLLKEVKAETILYVSCAPVNIFGNQIA
jgi:hypothetical protein